MILIIQAVTNTYLECFLKFLDYYILKSVWNYFNELFVQFLWPLALIWENSESGWNGSKSLSNHVNLILNSPICFALILEGIGRWFEFPLQHDLFVNQFLNKF